MGRVYHRDRTNDGRTPWLKLRPTVLLALRCPTDYQQPFLGGTVMALGIKFPSISFIVKVAISGFIVMLLLKLFPGVRQTIGNTTGVMV